MGELKTALQRYVSGKPSDYKVAKYKSFIGSISRTLDGETRGSERGSSKLPTFLTIVGTLAAALLAAPALFGASAPVVTSQALFSTPILLASAQSAFGLSWLVLSAILAAILKAKVFDRPNDGIAAPIILGALLGFFATIILSALFAPLLSSAVLPGTSKILAAGGVSLAAIPWFLGIPKDWPGREELSATTWREQRVVDEAVRFISQNDQSGSSKALIKKFLDQDGRILVQRGGNYLWHSRSVGNAYENPIVVFTEHALSGGVPTASVGAFLVREVTNFWPPYGWDDPSTPQREDTPASVEKRALVTGYAAVGFALSTESNSQGWKKAQDHRHHGLDPTQEGALYWWGFYQLVRFASLGPGIVYSALFAYLRDKVATELNLEPNFQYSLTERLEGVYDRYIFAPADSQLPPSERRLIPDPRNGQPVTEPGFKRIDPATYQNAIEEIYGKDGNGDQNPGTGKYSDGNFLGLLRNILLQWDPLPQ